MSGGHRSGVFLSYARADGESLAHALHERIARELPQVDSKFDRVLMRGGVSWLSAGTAAAGLAQINALSNLAGFGTTYAVGFIKDTTGSFALALLPLVALSALASVTILWIGRSRPSLAVAADNAAVTPA